MGPGDSVYYKKIEVLNFENVTDNGKPQAHYIERKSSNMHKSDGLEFALFFLQFRS